MGGLGSELVVRWDLDRKSLEIASIFLCSWELSISGRVVSFRMDVGLLGLGLVGVGLCFRAT